MSTSEQRAVLRHNLDEVAAVLLRLNITAVLAQCVLVTSPYQSPSRPTIRTAGKQRRPVAASVRFEAADILNSSHSCRSPPVETPSVFPGCRTTSRLLVALQAGAQVALAAADNLYNASK